MTALSFKKYWEYKEHPFCILENVQLNDAWNQIHHNKNFVGKLEKKKRRDRHRIAELLRDYNYIYVIFQSDAPRCNFHTEKKNDEKVGEETSLMEKVNTTIFVLFRI